MRNEFLLLPVKTKNLTNEYGWASITGGEEVQEEMLLKVREAGVTSCWGTAEFGKQTRLVGEGILQK